jgi:hypothetical protein
MGGGPDSGSGSGSGSGVVAPTDRLQHLSLPTWFTEGQQKVLEKIRQHKTKGDIHDAMREHARLARKLSHDTVKARPAKDPRQLYEATLAESPADAPLVISVDPAVQKKFEALFKEHLAEGPKGNERGGTLVWAPSGKWALVNEGASKSGNFFLPNLKVPPDHSVVGSFHTHVQADKWARSSTGLSDVAPGGDDIAYMLDHKHDVVIVHAADKEFLLLRTDGTPANVDTDKIRREHKTELNAGTMANGRVHGSDEVTQRLAKEYAEKYGLAYYEGKNGTFNRVWPPS